MEVLPEFGELCVCEVDELLFAVLLEPAAHVRVRLEDVFVDALNRVQLLVLVVLELIEVVRVLIFVQGSDALLPCVSTWLREGGRTHVARDLEALLGALDRHLHGR